jgi:ligand-binding SRPBCC domain-containing protein
MPILTFEMKVRAPVERCFDLSRSIDLHSSLRPKHAAVGGVTHGLIGKGETVSWKGSLSGFTLRHTSLVDEFDRPNYFRDVMVKGLFKDYEHQHFLAQEGEYTKMRDVVTFHAPFGIFGLIAEAVFVTRYLTRLLNSRNEIMKKVAESGEWKEYLP